jgi:hypothetical protein
MIGLREYEAYGRQFTATIGNYVAILIKERNNQGPGGWISVDDQYEVVVLAPTTSGRFFYFYF